MTTTLTLQPDATSGLDTTLNGFGTSVTFNYGISTGMTVGNTGAWQKALIKFDLSSLPANIHVFSAYLTLEATSKNGSPVVSVHRSLVEWYEGTKNGAAPSGGEDGSNWSYRNHNGSVAWVGGSGGQSGDDYDGTATDDQTVSATGNITWDVTADVQNFADSVYTNHGWWLIAPNTSSVYAIFRASDSIVAANRPQLVIEYAEIQTTTLSATADVHISEASPDNNYGVTTLFSVGDDGSDLGRKSLIKFNEADFPDSYRILTATLRLYALSELNSVNTYTYIYRSLVEWFEGNADDAVGSGDRTTWNYRNANGSVAWPSGAGGGSAGNGVESASVATASVLFSAPGVYLEYNVVGDVNAFVDGTYPNYGWWVRGIALTNALKSFASREHATAGFRPELVIEYVSEAASISASSSGSAVGSGTLRAKGILQVSAAGVATVEGRLISNEFLIASISGLATVAGTLRAKGYAAGNSIGDSVPFGDMSGVYHLIATSAGESFSIGDIKGVFYLLGATAGEATADAIPSFEGQLRGNSSGSAVGQATGYAKALHVATVIGCNPVPLLYITDGTLKPNGQLNMVNLLSERYGYKLRNYQPQIAQYKEGGRFSSSPLSQGRRLTFRTFENAIDVFELAAVGRDQDFLIEYQQELLAFQEAAADYWITDWVSQPVYLVAKAARETNTRYAIIHVMNMPELTNPYAQPFFDHNQAAFDVLTLRIERGHWLSSPPGTYDCVEISSQRSWTVSGWQSGS